MQECQEKAQFTFDIELQWNPGNLNSDGKRKQFELAGFPVIGLNFSEILFKGKECVNLF